MLPACPQGCELPAFGEAGGHGGGVSQSRLRPLHAAIAAPQPPPTGTPMMMAALHPQGGRPPGLCDGGGQGWYCAFDALPPPPPAPPFAMVPTVPAPKKPAIKIPNGTVFLRVRASRSVVALGADGRELATIYTAQKAS